MSTSGNEGAHEWLRAMADKTWRSGGFYEASGLEAVARRVEHLERENAELRERLKILAILDEK